MQQESMKQVRRKVGRENRESTKSLAESGLDFQKKVFLSAFTLLQIADRKIQTDLGIVEQIFRRQLHVAQDRSKQPGPIVSPE